MQKQKSATILKLINNQQNDIQILCNFGMQF